MRMICSRSMNHGEFLEIPKSMTLEPSNIGSTTTSFPPMPSWIPLFIFSALESMEWSPCFIITNIGWLNWMKISTYPYYQGNSVAGASDTSILLRAQMLPMTRITDYTD